MEIKKTEKASLENKRVLFAEIGFIISFLVVFLAFEYKTKADNDKEEDAVEFAQAEEETIPITEELPPPPPPAVQEPEISFDDISIVENDEIQDIVIDTEENDLAVDIIEYTEAVDEEEEIEEEAIPFALVETKPSFQGGDANDFSKWVNEHLEYPEIAKENGVEGRVILSFTVMPNGSLGNVQVLRGVDPSLDQEAVRVIKMSPKWTPGKQRDRVTKVTYTFPVIFKLR